MVREQRIDAAERARGLVSGFADSGQEEIEPSFPVACGPHAIEVFVVGGAVGFEVETQAEDWLAERFLSAKKERNQQPPEPSVSVQEGVDRFKLDMDQADLDE